MARAMKDSGIEWIGEIPEGWQVPRIKNIIQQTKNGIKIGPFGSALTNKTTEKGEYNVYSQANLIASDFSFTKNTIDAYTFEELKGYEVFPGDICLSMMGTIGKCKKVPVGIVRGIMDSHLIKIRLSESVDSRFFEYVYDKDLGGVCFSQMQFDKKGFIMDGLNTSIVKNLFFPLPSKYEQVRIADFLDSECARIDAVIEQTRASIEEYKKLKQSVITLAVTKGIRPGRKMKDSGVEWIGEIPESYKLERVKHLGNYRNGLTYTPEDVVDEGQGTLVLRSSNIQHGKLCFDDNVYVNSEIPERLLVQKGDIIICSRNGSRDLIGKCAIVEENLVASFGAFMMIFRGRSPKYMYYILNSDVFKYYLSTFLTATINQLTGSNFGNMAIVWCDDELEQYEIVKYLDKETSRIEKIITHKARLLTELESYKKSLIFEYVTGKKVI